MHSSTFMPWLLVGPIIVMLIANIVYNVTDYAPAKYLAMACLAWVAGFVVVAFVSNWLFVKTVMKDREKLLKEEEKTKSGGDSSDGTTTPNDWE